MDCIVPGCPSRRGVQHHLFPMDVRIGEQWVKAVCSPKLAKFSYGEIRKKKYRVCYKHFAADSWIATFVRPRLKDNIIPTLFLPSSPLLECVVPTDNIPIDSTDRRITEKLPTEFSPPSLKYVRSPQNSEIRRSSLSSPPGRQAVKRAIDISVDSVLTETVPSIKKRKTIGSTDCLKNVNPAVATSITNKSLYDLLKKFVKRKLSLSVSVDSEVTSVPLKECKIEPADEEVLDVKPPIDFAINSQTVNLAEVEPSTSEGKDVITGKASPKIQQLKGKHKKRVVPDLIKKRLQRRLVARKMEVVDFILKTKRVFEEASRLRKELRRTKDRATRYATANASMRIEIASMRDKIHLLESKCILSKSDDF